MQSPWNKFLSKLTPRSHEAGILFGAVSILAVSAVSLTLLFQIGASARPIDQYVYSGALKQASLARLDRKFSELPALPGKMQAIPNLDMPSGDALDTSLQSVDLFGRPFTRQEMCIAQAVYFEARSEPLVGQIAIAEVILNRIADTRYPDTACDVVFQNQDRKHRCQFSFACDGLPDRPTNTAAWEKSLKVVALVMKGERSGVARRATHYHATYVSPGWSVRLSKLGQVGSHIFYREETI
jgi:spore germination cell wall hydrolase CwlJ-like protein|tara:strand:- start:1818 stop:2537 length:720 start_codon:yes stop_codon:yes gene_type:complete